MYHKPLDFTLPVLPKGCSGIRGYFAESPADIVSQERGGAGFDEEIDRAGAHDADPVGQVKAPPASGG